MAMNNNQTKNFHLEKDGVFVLTITKLNQSDPSFLIFNQHSKNRYL